MGVVDWEGGRVGCGCGGRGDGGRGVGRAEGFEVKAPERRGVLGGFGLDGVLARQRCRRLSIRIGGDAIPVLHVFYFRCYFGDFTFGVGIVQFVPPPPEHGHVSPHDSDNWLPLAPSFVLSRLPGLDAQVHGLAFRACAHDRLREAQSCRKRLGGHGVLEQLDAKRYDEWGAVGVKCHFLQFFVGDWRVQTREGKGSFELGGR